MQVFEPEGIGTHMPHKFLALWTINHTISHNASEFKGLSLSTNHAYTKNRRMF